MTSPDTSLARVKRGLAVSLQGAGVWQAADAVYWDPRRDEWHADLDQGAGFATGHDYAELVQNALAYYEENEQ